MMQKDGLETVVICKWDTQRNSYEYEILHKSINGLRRKGWVNIITVMCLDYRNSQKQLCQQK